MLKFHNKDLKLNLYFFYMQILFNIFLKKLNTQLEPVIT